MKKAITLILLASLLTSLSACGGTAAPTDDAAGESTTAAPVETDIFDGIEVRDYGGREFNWLIPNMAEYAGDMWVEEATGEVYDDALYARNNLVQERFGVKINPIIEDYSWDVREQYLGRVRSSVQAGDHAYDLVACQSYVLPGLILDKMLLNLNSVQSLRLDKPWWSQLVYENLTYNDQIYYMAGDISANVLEFANVVFVNKRLLKEFKRESPYDLVRAGKWTIDALAAMIKDTSTDLDGNSVWDGKDSYGYIWHDNTSINNIHISLGTSTSRRAGDTILFNLDSDDAAFCAEYADKFLRENPDTHQALTKTGGSGLEVFTSGRAMFYAHFLFIERWKCAIW